MNAAVSPCHGILEFAVVAVRTFHTAGKAEPPETTLGLSRPVCKVSELAHQHCRVPGLLEGGATA